MTVDSVGILEKPVSKKCFIIAEIGVNHNGDIKLAKKLIKSSKDAGADAVKFQSYKTDLLASRTTPKVKYQELRSNKSETHYEMLRRLELSEAMQAELKRYCEDIGITFMSTPYDIESARFLHEDLDVEVFKTASADIVDHELQRYIARTNKHSIVSVGMADMKEIEEVIAIYTSAGNERLSLLQCTSSYPCSNDDLHLACIPSLMERTKLQIGFSDHSVGSLASVVAYGLGARIIEKHITLDKNMEGPDHNASADMREFNELVQMVRKAEDMLGDEKKRCSQSELQMRDVSRKSAHAKTNLKAGDILTQESVLFKRPGTGIHGNMFKDCVGRALKYDIDEGQMITWGDIDE